MPFKVIEDGINQKPACDFLSVTNTNWHANSYHFRVITAYCSNFWHFSVSEPPFGGSRPTYNVHLGLIGKRVVDFLIPMSANKLFVRGNGWGATGENKSKIGRWVSICQISA